MAVPTEPASHPQPIPSVDLSLPNAATGGSAGTNQAGTNQAGTNPAGTDPAGAGPEPAGRSELPPLPPVRGAGLAHVLILATALWLVALVVLLFTIPTLRSHDAMLWLWTALAGWLLGFVGLAIYSWQRAAARRGSRGASTLALDEQIGAP